MLHSVGDYLDCTNHLSNLRNSTVPAALLNTRSNGTNDLSDTTFPRLPPLPYQMFKGLYAQPNESQSCGVPQSSQQSKDGESRGGTKDCHVRSCWDL